MEMKLELPSAGRIYPIDSISVRSMKGIDEKLLADLNLENLEKKYLALLSNKDRSGNPLVKGIDPQKLTLGDRLYILLWERINSYSKNFRVELVCQYCFEKIATTIDLTTIEEKPLPETFKEPYEITLSNNDKVSLRLFRLEDEIKIIDREKKDGAEKTYLYKLALSMVDDRDILTRISYLEDLEGRDISLIKKFHEDFDHGPNINQVKYTCSKCEEVGHMSLPFRPNFLIPGGNEIVN
jgi:hypothetical protein